MMPRIFDNETGRKPLAFAADAVVMEKVGECGLMLFRDGGDEGRKIVGEDEGWATKVRYSTLISRVLSVSLRSVGYSCKS